MIRGSQVDQSNIVRRKFKVNWHEEEARTKLHILISLARSQRALSRILESVADVAEKTEPAGERLVEQMEALSKYQRQIAVKMIGIKIRKKPAESLKTVDQPNAGSLPSSNYFCEGIVFYCLSVLYFTSIRMLNVRSH